MSHCTKVGYVSLEQAKKARGAVGRRKRFNKRLRAYSCPVCKLWHLTSEGRLQ